MEVLKSVVVFYANRDTYFEIYRGFMVLYAATTWKIENKAAFCWNFFVRICQQHPNIQEFMNFVIPNACWEENASPEKVLCAFLCLCLYHNELFKKSKRKGWQHRVLSCQKNNKWKLKKLFKGTKIFSGNQRNHGFQFGLFDHLT